MADKQSDTSSGKIPTNVLIAEDNEAIAKALRRAFESKGFSVHHVDNADEVLPSLEHVSPNLLILDIMMPSKQNLDGFSLCKQIKNTSAYKNLPVVIITGIASGMKDSEEHMCQLSGADACLFKPFSLDYMMERLQPFLR